MQRSKPVFNTSSPSRYACKPVILGITLNRFTSLALVAGLLGWVVGATAFQRLRWNADVNCAPDTNLIPTPYRLREIEGIVKEPAGYPWGRDVHIFVEIISKIEPAETRIARTDSSGKFLIKDVGDGEYRFRIGMSEVGWACTEGTIIVSKKSGSNSKVEITLRPGR